MCFFNDLNNKMQNFFTVHRSQKRKVSYVKFYHKGKWQKVHDVLHLFDQHIEVNQLKCIEYAWIGTGEHPI